ncbi:hypothetical protein J14TS5_11510 [Paenibacillus lautus]|nr:hypothetical protein J14TS5_11510 [Paenibacillus lautus]
MCKFIGKALVPISFGLLLAVIWLPIGIIFFMNHLAGGFTLKYIMHFLLGLPLIAVLIGLICLRKKAGITFFLFHLYC